MADETDDLTAHPDFVATGAAIESEFRAQQDDATADAAEQLRHNQTLADHLIQTMHRGDRLGVTVIRQRFAGMVEEVGDDLVALRTLSGRVDIHLAPGIPVHFETVDRATQGGARGANIANTFRAALLAREGGGLMTVATLFDPDGVDGELLIGHDFAVVVARAGAEHTVPIANIAWVTARRF